MAELAGRAGDGICAPAGPKHHELVAVARRAHARTSRQPLLVTAYVRDLPERTPPGSGLDVDRLIVYVAPPLGEGVARLREIIGRWPIGVIR
jgi:hypothetical protein